MFTGALTREGGRGGADDGAGAPHVVGAALVDVAAGAASGGGGHVDRGGEGGAGGGGEERVGGPVEQRQGAGVQRGRVVLTRAGGAVVAVARPGARVLAHGGPDGGHLVLLLAGLGAAVVLAGFGGAHEYTRNDPRIVVVGRHGGVVHAGL